MSTYAQVVTIRRCWIIPAFSRIAMFATLLFFGREIYHAKPPIPEAVRTESGQVLYTHDDIQRGQGVWQAMGGMQQGSIWGHGGYLAPDWSADWLHREALAYLDIIAQEEEGAPYAELDERGQGYARAALQLDVRRNTHDPETGVATVADARARAMAQVEDH